MNKKQLLIWALVAALIILTNGCGKKKTDSTVSTDTFTVAMVTDGEGVDDHGFNQAAWEAVQEFAASTNRTYAYYQPSQNSRDELTRQIDHAVNRGAKVIVLPGQNFQGAVYDAQQKYPDIIFLVLDTVPRDDEGNEKIDGNVSCILFREEQSGFLAGYAAVREGYTRLGFLGGVPVEPVTRYGYGFVQGADRAALEMNADVQINFAYADSFSPSEKITAKVNKWYENGTQVVFACGGTLYESVVQAAEAHNGFVIGVDSDQASISSTIITSAIKQIKMASLEALNALASNNGQWPADRAGQAMVLGAENNAVGLPTDPESWRMKNFTLEDYQNLFDKVASGNISVDDSSDADSPIVTKSVKVNWNAE